MTLYDVSDEIAVKIQTFNKNIGVRGLHAVLSGQYHWKEINSSRHPVTGHKAETVWNVCRVEHHQSVRPIYDVTHPYTEFPNILLHACPEPIFPISCRPQTYRVEYFPCDLRSNGGIR